MGCSIEENRNSIKQDSTELAKKLVKGNAVSTDTILSSNHVLEVNFRPISNDLSIPFIIAKEFYARFIKHHKGTDIVVKSREDDSSYISVSLPDYIMVSLSEEDTTQEESQEVPYEDIVTFLDTVGVKGKQGDLFTSKEDEEQPIQNRELKTITPKVNIVNYRTMDDKSKEDAMNGVEEAQKRWVEEEIAEFYEAIEQYNKGLDTFSSKGVNKGKATMDDVIDETLGIFRTVQMFPKFSDVILPYLEDIKTALNTFGRKEGYAIYKAKKDAKGQAKEMTYENLFETVDKFIKQPINKEIKPNESLKQIQKDFEIYNDHPDVDYYTKGYVGKVVDETLTDLCAVTSNICISFLHSKGINVLYKPFHIYPTLKIANFKGDFVNHKVAISYINNKMYIFDMPQNEYITLNKKGEAVLGEFKPRFIEVTPENMQKYYGIDKESYINTFEKFKVGGFEPFFLGAPKDTYVNFQESIINYFKEGSPVWSVSDYSKYMKDKSIKPTYTFKTQEQPIDKEIKPNEVTKFFETKFNLPVEYDNTLSPNIGGYVKDGKVFLNPNINPDKLEETIIEEYTHVITTKLEKEHPEVFEGLFNDLINTPEYKEIRDKAIAKVNSLYPELTKNEVEKLLNKGIEQQNQVNYTLKSVNILQSKEGQDIWNKGIKNNWSLDKIFTEMKIPKEQITLVKDIHHNILNKGRVGILTPQELLKEIWTDLLANYSYAVEINTASEKKGYDYTNDTFKGLEKDFIFSYKEHDYFFESPLFFRVLRSTMVKEPISKKEAENVFSAFRETKIKENKTPTQYYSNLTVPGGTNYTENAIRIPGVVNIISKDGGYHDNQFNESRGDMAGWFRSDDEVKGADVELLDIQDEYDEMGRNLGRPPLDTFTQQGGTPTKTRRVLEIQSFFQKVRDKDNLINEYSEEYQNVDGNTIDEIIENRKNIKSNQFLQLLNKNNNWVTFFVKSIIQDSAKKGYEKVLFPRLDTIIQIESKGRYKSYADAEKAMKDENWYKKDKELKEKLEEARKELKGKKEEVAKIKSNPNYDKTLDYETPIKNLERRASDAYEKWHAIQPTLLNTAKFYENDITNILNKLFRKGNVNIITDEYGNTWNELTLTEKQRQELILLSKLTGEIDNSKTQLPTKITQSFKHEVLGQAAAMATKNKVSSGLSKIANDILKWIKDALSKIGFKNVNTIKTFKDLKQVFEDNNIRIDLNQPTEIKPKIEIVSRYSDSEVKENPDKIYVFGDNTDRVGTGGQASIRNNPNAFGIATKLHPTNNTDAFMSDEDLEDNKKVIDGDIQKIIDEDKPLVFPKDGFGTGLAKLKEKAPQTYQYLKEQLLEKFGFDNDTGEIVEQSIKKEKQSTEIKHNIQELLEDNPELENSIYDLTKFTRLLKYLKITTSPIGTPLTEKEGIGICDGTCGLMAYRLESNGLSYGHTKIEDAVANYHAIALTQIEDKLYILNQPQVEFIGKEYQKAPLWERAVYWTNQKLRYSRHLSEFNTYILGYEIPLHIILTDKPFIVEGEEQEPLLKNLTSTNKTILNPYYIENNDMPKELEVVEKTATLISDPEVKLKWTDYGESEFEVPIEDNLEVTKNNEQVFIWTDDKYTPRLIEATKENLISEYRLSEEQATISMKNISEAKIIPENESKQRLSKEESQEAKDLYSKYVKENNSIDLEGFEQFLKGNSPNSLEEKENENNLVTLPHGEQYDPSKITSSLLESLNYTPIEIGKILQKLC